MKCFVTGANGFIGYELTKELIRQNHRVNILVRRDFHKFSSENLTVFQGDLWNVEAIRKGMKGCDCVFHLAAYARIWSKDRSLPYRTNVAGTRNILECAVQNNIKRVIFTSTAGVFAPSANHETVDENTPMPETYLTDYEKTKREAELLCLEYYKNGLDVIILNPTRVFGPGMLNKSNSVTILIQKYLKGKWRFIPGSGKSVGNYVFIDDLVYGHILAMQYGLPGEKYILGGTNISLNDLFTVLSEVTGKKRRLYHLPLFIIFLFAHCDVVIASFFGKPPLITPQWVKRYIQNRALSSQKAVSNLKYSITPLKESLLKTIYWLNSKTKKHE